MSKNLKETGEEALSIFKGRFWHRNSGSKILQVGVYLEYSRNSRETSEAEVVGVSRCGQEVLETIDQGLVAVLSSLTLTLNEQGSLWIF